MTAAPMTISHDGLDDEQQSRLVATLASLPMTFRPAKAGRPGDVVAVGGPDWALRTDRAAAAGARGILLLDPWPLEHPALREVAAVRRPVVVDTGWRHNPAVDTVRDGVARYRRPGALLEVRSAVRPGEDLVRAAVGPLDLVTAVAGGLAGLEVLRHDARHLVLGGELADGGDVLLTVLTTRARPRSTSLTVAGDDGRAELALPDPGTAAPGVAALVGPAGRTVLPHVSESARRGALRCLAAAVETDAAPDDLPRLLDAAALLAAAIEEGRRSVPGAQPTHDTTGVL
ncbi:hypothetical protein [Georgenia alba]|uniref:Uncharacterized protein n=1 Tax=Georgenia alba TaxID=2233858 RepID=A0ABW2Q8R9_9MICO